MENAIDLAIRQIKTGDGAAIIEIDALHSDERKPEFWHAKLRNVVPHNEKQSKGIGYVAVAGGRIIGYILAEGRAWEFGSPLCGWIFAIGVDPRVGRKGVGLALCAEVCAQFKKLGIGTVRTMVRKDNVDVLSFFRASGFKAGPFIELELDL